MIIGVVEDNGAIREPLKRYLELEGWQVVDFPLLAPLERRLEAMAHPGAQPWDLDLLILDVMLPDGDGFLFARRLRRWWQGPVMFLTARAEESDRITGLELGADDYVTKPFSSREVVLRVKALLRRAELKDGPGAGAGPGGSGRFACGGHDLDLDALTMEARLDGSRLVLTAAEWTILQYLMSRAPQVCSRAQILQACLDSISEGSERTVDTHVKNLRHKLGSAPWIETVRSFGYRFAGSPVQQ